MENPQQAPEFEVVSKFEVDDAKPPQIRQKPPEPSHLLQASWAPPESQGIISLTDEYLADQKG